MKPTNFDTPVFILGAPRSGTSLVTGALGQCGLWLGPQRKGNRANPKGFFENPEFKRRVTKRLLRELGADPLGVHALPSLDQPRSTPALRLEIHALVANQGYDGQGSWGVKDPKLTLIWPTLLGCFPHARWIVVRRDAVDNVQSCLRVKFLSRHSSDEAFWWRFLREYETRLRALVDAAPLCREICSRTLVYGDVRSLREIVAWLCLEWHPERVERFVEPRYWHFHHAS
ncbi:MAG: sulfotransferase [Pirellulales bacterium]